MRIVQRALWYLESHSRQPLTLAEIAAACRVSAFHLTRAFAAVTGHSLMRYLRARRLSQAARQLAGGADDILGVALEAGYGSHEAFTRAFRDQFAITPEAVRAQGHTRNLALMEPLAMNNLNTPEIEAPRIERQPARLLAGLVRHYPCQQAPAGIPDQWQQLGPYLGRIPTEIGDHAYGVCYNVDAEDNMDYLCGVEISAARDLPEGFRTLALPEQRYAIFRHRDHVASIRDSFAAIWDRWLPESGYRSIEAPVIECYGPDFDPATGLGGLDLWVPLAD